MVVKVDSQFLIDEFVRFPFEVYSDLKNCLWVPRLVEQERFALDRDHPFYEGDSEAQAFLAKNDGVQGRIMALKSADYNNYHDTKKAFFYFFEAVDDQQVADALFGAVFDWARAHGLDAVMGPMGMLAGGGHGILVKGFYERPGMNMNWNPPYYQRLIEEAGFEKLADSLSAQVLIDFEAKWEKAERIYDSAVRLNDRSNNQFEPKIFSKREVKTKMDWIVPQMTRLYNESFGDLPLFHPMDSGKMRRIIDELLSLTNNKSIKLTKFVQKGDDIVGFLLAYPNVVPGLRRVNGRLNLWKKAYLKTYQYLTGWVDANGIGVLPEVQRRGVTVLLYKQFLKTLQNSRYRHLIINQIAEENKRNLREMSKTFGLDHLNFDRTHRIYTKKL